MYPYIYADAGAKGYKLFSNDPSLGQDRQSSLQGLFHYVGNPKRSVGFHAQSFTGLLTDLGVSQDYPHYFFQSSAAWFERNATFTQGFTDIIPTGNETFFRDKFLDLLRADFKTMDEIRAMPLLEQGAQCLPTLTDLPPLDDTLVPADIPEGLLSEILVRLLNNKKVYLIMDKTGAEAVRYARQLLLRIYSCLPYNARRFCGFMTDVTETRLAAKPGSLDMLPASVHLLLIDAKEAVPPTCAGKTLNMAAKYPLYEDKTGLLHFLMQEPSAGQSDPRTVFFDQCSEFLSRGDDKFLTWLTYTDFYSMQKLACQPVSLPSIIEWTDFLKRNSTQPEFRRQFLALLKKNVTPDAITAYFDDSGLLGKLPSLEKISVFANPSFLQTDETAGQLKRIADLFGALFPEEGTEKIVSTLSDFYLNQLSAFVKNATIVTPCVSFPSQYCIQKLESILAAFPAVPNKRELSVFDLLLGQLRSIVSDRFLKEKNIYGAALAAEKDKLIHQLGDSLLFSSSAPLRYQSLCNIYSGSLNCETFPVLFDLRKSGREQDLLSDISDLICKYADNIPMPASLDQIEPYLLDLRYFEAEDCALRNSQILREHELRIAPYSCTLVDLLKQSKMESVSSMLCFGKKLSSSSYDSLKKSLLDECWQLFHQKAQSTLLSLSEIQTDLESLKAIAACDAKLVRDMTAVLWSFSLDDSKAVRSYQQCSALYSALSTPLNAKICLQMLNGSRLDMTTTEVDEWISWISKNTLHTVPAAVLNCAKESPRLVIYETTDDSKLNLLANSLTGQALDAYLCSLIECPVPENDMLVNTTIQHFLQHDCPEEQLTKAAHPSWAPLIQTLYQNPAARISEDTLHKMSAAIENANLAINDYPKSTLPYLPLVLMLATSLSSWMPVILLWIFHCKDAAAFVGVLIGAAAEALILTGLFFLLRIVADHQKEARKISLQCMVCAVIGLLLSLLGVILVLVL